jgi:exonuclease V
MKLGTRIHQALEDEIHTVVQVQVDTREDRFALRIWNAIQGLRSLQEIGFARELELWGILEGEVINGVIDELSYNCPDANADATVMDGATLLSKQPTLEQYITKPLSTGLDECTSGTKPQQQVYIADIKTRGVRSIPAGASLRPTRMQLMLYKKLLESLSQNLVDAELIFARYNLAPLAPFSDIFMHQFNATSTQDNRDKGENPPSLQHYTDIRSYPNLLSLWSLMIAEYQRAIPSVSDHLRAEYRYAKTGEVIGDQILLYDSHLVDSYLNQEMQWWKGRREAKGVEIEEAFKCRMCDFAEQCSWRQSKLQEAVEKHRLRSMKKDKSGI